MINIYNNVFIYPKAVILVLVSLTIIVWDVYLFKKLKNRHISVLDGYYKYYFTYSTGLFIWIVSNCYFHTGYLVLYSEDVATFFSLLANVAGSIACVSIFLFSCKVKQHFIKDKISIWKYLLAAVFSIYTVAINSIPNLTVQRVKVSGVSDFTIYFGEYGRPFVIFVVIIIVLAFINIISLKKISNELRKIKANYIIFGMVIFMMSVTVVQVGITLFFSDFSLTWLPPTLSISEMIFTGYALVTSRFYSIRYIFYSSSTFIITSLVYITPIVIINEFLHLSFIYICFYIPIIGLSWKKTFLFVKKWTTWLIYRSEVHPIEQLSSYIDDFKRDPVDAIHKISRMLDVPDEQMKIVKNDAELEFYRHYFSQSSDVLILDEVQEKLEFAKRGLKTLSELHERMNQSDAAIIIPIFDSQNDISHLFISTHKSSGRLFSNEEVKTLQRIIHEAQFYINSHVKVQKYSALAYSIAHEVRNPLSQVQSHLDLLKLYVLQNTDTQTILHGFDKASGAIQRGNQLIDIILREIGDSSVQASMSTVHTEQLISQSVDQFGFDDESYRQRIHIALEDGFPLKVNETLFNFVIFNLLRNALYYFSAYADSQVEIRTESGQKSNCIIFKDTGPGIPDDIRERIFEEFYSYDKPNGSGLGLSYCQRVMRAFGGSIQCDSEYGEFTEFRLHFPKVSVSAAELSALTEHTVTSDSSKPEILPTPEIQPVSPEHLILVVDDMVSQRVLLATYLKQLGYQVIEAGNGQEALALFQSRPVALVIMDVQMPVMNGFDATRAMKALRASVPVIAFSGESGEREIALIQEIMDDRLSKPFHRSELQSVVAHWLKSAPLNTDESMSTDKPVIAEEVV